jgi:REP element-mobilizing transposase RayT
MNRGNRKAVIFEDDRDRKRFTRILEECVAEFDVELDGSTQMSTHFHLVVGTPHANISEFMAALEGRFAQYSNWRHRRVGHLFQGPYKAVVIDNDLHLFTALWYVFQNPVEAGLVARPEQWAWSTYAATAGLRASPPYLSLSWLDGMFPADSREASQALFRKCMEAPDPIAAYLAEGDPAADTAISCYVYARIKDANEPISCRDLFRPPIEKLFSKGQTKAERDNAIVTAHVLYGYKLIDIAAVLGLNPGSISRIFRIHRKNI